MNNIFSVCMQSVKCALLSVLVIFSAQVYAESKGGGEGTSTGGPAFYTMDPVVVNLAGDDVRHYLQVSIVFQVDDPAVVENLKLYSPILRSRAILVLSSKFRKDVDNIQGRQRLMDELVDMARHTLPEGAHKESKNKEKDKDHPANKGIEDVLLTAFVIQ